jgi:hypothetical protein
MAAVPFLAAIAFLVLRPSLAMDPDSPTYLDWSPIRSAGYPLFLDLFDGPYLLHLQLLLLAGAIAWAAYFSFHLFGRLLLTGLLTLGLIANPYMWVLQGSVMSEAVTTPLIIIFLGCTVGFAATSRPSLALAASLLAAVIAAARPACLPLFIPPMLAVLLLPGRAMASRLKLALACLCIWLAPLAAERLYAQAVHGERLTSLAGRHIFAKASLIDGQPVDRMGLTPLETRLADLMEREYEPVRRLLRSSEGSSAHRVLLANYEVCIQYACTNRASGFVGEERVLHEALSKVGGARLRSNPLGYLELAWNEYLGFWLLHQRKHPGLADGFNQFVTRAGRLPFQAQLGTDVLPVQDVERSAFFRVNRLFFTVLGLLAFIVTIGSVVLLIYRSRHPFVYASFLSAVALQGVLVFTAFTGIGIPRYTMSMWPAIVFMVVFTSFFMVDLVRSSRKHQPWG